MPDAIARRRVESVRRACRKEARMETYIPDHVCSRDTRRIMPLRKDISGTWTNRKRTLNLSDGKRRIIPVG